MTDAGVNAEAFVCALLRRDVLAMERVCAQLNARAGGDAGFVGIADVVCDVVDAALERKFGPALDLSVSDLNRFAEGVVRSYQGVLPRITMSDVVAAARMAWDSHGEVDWSGPQLEAAFAIIARVAALLGSEGDAFVKESFEDALRRTV